MRALVVVSGAVGVAFGVAAAAVWHYARIRHGGFGWFAYAPLSGSTYPVHLHPSWWPSALVLPAIGLGAGLLVGTGLTRFGWRLSRDRSGTASSVVSPSA
jgi:hypothetical protein